MLATFGGGCFWCIEAVFRGIRGIEAIESGYAGGESREVTYELVCTGSTGHAEVVQLEYDPQLISYTQLLKVFFAAHDPTTLNRQGADIGTQYRSCIFYHSSEQQQDALAYIDQLNSLVSDPVVTELEAFTFFVPAEDTHQNFYNRNKSYPYCAIVAAPKVAAVRNKFSELWQFSE